MLTERQKKLRLRGIGASEIAAVAGIPCYMTPLELYQRKVGLEPDPLTETEQMRWGNCLEASIAAAYAQRLGTELRKSGHRVHPTERWMRATPDYIRVFDKVPVQIKNIRFPDGWGPDMSQEVPDQYRAQVAWEMAVLDAPRADLVALVGGCELRIYPLSRDLELEAKLVEAGRNFWQNHVLVKIPPPAQNEDERREFLQKLFPKHSDKVLPATSEDEALASELSAAIKWWAQAQDVEFKALDTVEEVKNRFRERMGEAVAIEGSGWRVTWKANADKAQVDWAKVVQEAGVAPGIVAKHTKMKPGARVFRTHGSLLRGKEGGE